MKLLSDLLSDVVSASWPRAKAAALPIRRLSADSRDQGPDGLFVAIRGTRHDGHDRVPEAIANGAIAVVVEREIRDPGVPLVRVANTRRALAELAAAWHDHPADKLTLVGITGTLGKTSVLMMIESILAEAECPTMTIGSLGVHIGQSSIDTGHTVPGPLVLHEALARGVDQGARLAVMEVTSHALMQERVHGLRFELGVFTNLVPLEHMEYHGSFEEYAAAKVRFFDHLVPGAPVVYSAGDPALQMLIDARDVHGIGAGRGAAASARIENLELDADGTAFDLDVPDSLPVLGGGEPERGVLALRTGLLGRSNANNTALAALSALCLGAPASAVVDGLSRMEAPQRRMKIVHRGRVLVLDDTVGHPDSITAVFEVAQALPHRRLHVVFAIRGQRGTEVNRGDADAIAIWSERLAIATLMITRSTDTADERNTVSEEEWRVFSERLLEIGCPFEERARLSDAVDKVISHADDGDVVLLLGAQGMDAGAELALSALE